MEEMKCPFCGEINTDDSIFCIGCGNRIGTDAEFNFGFNKTDSKKSDIFSAIQSDGHITCPKCGELLEPDSIFCDNCGIRLTNTTVPEEIPVITHEKNMISKVPEASVEEAISLSTEEVSNGDEMPKSSVIINMRSSSTRSNSANQNDRFKILTGFDDE